MLPMEEKPRLPARERWVWLGVGFASALAVLALGLVFVTFVTARGAPKRIVLQQPAPVALPPLSSARPLPAAPAKRTSTRKKPRARVVRRKPPKPLVRVVERPVAAAQPSVSSTLQHAPEPSAASPSPAGPRPSAPGTRVAGPADSERVAGSRQEWNGAPPLRGWQGASPADETRSVTPPRLLQSHGADYPTSAMAEGVTGRVRVKMNIGPDGFVDGVVITRSSGDARLDAAAVRAALTWRYLPARRNGIPVASEDYAQFEFFRRGD